MAATEDELDHLASTKETAQIEIEHEETEEDLISPKPTKKGGEKDKEDKSKRLGRLTSVSQSSMQLVAKMDEHKHPCLCCDHNCCAKFINISVVIGSLLYAIISMIVTPIAAIFVGKKLETIFNKYSISDIDSMCNDNYEAFVWNNWDIGTHGFHMFVFGMIDLLFTLCFATCLVSYLLNSTRTDKFCISMVTLIRVFFMIVWLLYGRLMIGAYIKVNDICDQGAAFREDMNDIFVWFIPIISISIACTLITFIITFVLCICFCQIDFRFF